MREHNILHEFQTMASILSSWVNMIANIWGEENSGSEQSASK